MVGVFFVISGYVLTNKPLQLCRKQDHAAMYKSISSGMFRRWFRLWVPAYFSTFLAVLAIQADLDIDSPAGPQQHPKLASFSLQVSDWFWEMARFSNPFGYRDHHEQLRMRYDWVTWTLPLEFWAGIALWVVCMAVCQFPRYAVRLTLLLLLAYYALSNGSWHFFCFLSGMMICDLDIESKTFVPKGGIFEILTRRNRQILYWCIFIFGLYIAGAPGIPEYDVWGMDAPGYRWLYARIPHWFHEPYRFYLSWTGITLVFAATRLPALQRCLEADPIQALGRVSFSFFLLHQTSHDVLVTNWLGPALMRWLHTDRSTTWGNNLWFFTMFTLTTPIIYLFASLFQRYVEGNCDRLTRWTEDQFRARAVSPKTVKHLLPQ